MAQNGTLSTKQRRAIAALIAERTEADAAQTAGVARRTLVRWLGDPAFVAELRAAEGQAIDHAVRRLTGLADTAILGLEVALKSKDSSPALRLRAGVAILNMLITLRGAHTTEQRLAALEEVLLGKP